MELGRRIGREVCRDDQQRWHPRRSAGQDATPSRGHRKAGDSSGFFVSTPILEKAVGGIETIEA